MKVLLLIFNLYILCGCLWFYVDGTVTLESMVYWSNATVPFFINSHHYDEQQTQTIIKALDRFDRLTCIKFVPVFVLPKKGRVLDINNPNGLRQCHFTSKTLINEPHNLVLGYDCLTEPNIDMFIMRSLGFNFEHNRPGRDIYISVLVENVEPGSVELYTKDIELPKELRELPYDYNSVMHFSTRERTKNGHRTILFKNKDVGQQRTTLTDTDLRKIALVYGPHCRLRKRNEQISACNKFVPTDTKYRKRRHARPYEKNKPKGLMRTRLFIKGRRELGSNRSMETAGTERPKEMNVHTKHNPTKQTTYEPGEEYGPTTEKYKTISINEEANATIDNNQNQMAIVKAKSNENGTIRRGINLGTIDRASRNSETRKPSTTIDPLTNSSANHPSTTIDLPEVASSSRRPMTSIDPPDLTESSTGHPSTTVDLPNMSETNTSPNIEIDCPEPAPEERDSEFSRRRLKRSNQDKSKMRVRREDSAQYPQYSEEGDDESLERRMVSKKNIEYDTINMTLENKKYYRERKWINNVVPYIIADNGFKKGLIRKRLYEVNEILKQKTCVKLKEYSAEDVAFIKDYLVIDTTIDFDHGRIGGKQHFGAVELFQKNQPRQMAAMMVMSMLGFNFECTRHDREDFVAVYYHNIIEGKEHHFQKMPEAATLNLPYDYSSASHPTWKFWRKPLIHNRSTVATLKRTDPDTKIMRNLGENEKLLSVYDILKINTVYNCGDEP